MAILKIARMGHPILKQIAEAVPDPTAPSIARLVDNMVETMLDAPGQGLAAPQVHVSKRLVVYIPPPPDDVDDELGQDDGDESDPPYERKIRVLVNPVLSTLDDEMNDNWEGCLSVPDLRGVVPRYSRIHLAASRLDGSAIDETLSGWHARVVQHECDHLDGLLYPQRMTDLSSLTFETEMRHLIAEARKAREAAEAAEDQG
jgi:peptide deformylase